MTWLNYSDRNYLPNLAVKCGCFVIHSRSVLRSSATRVVPSFSSASACLASSGVNSLTLVMFSVEYFTTRTSVSPHCTVVLLEIVAGNQVRGVLGYFFINTQISMSITCVTTRSPRFIVVNGDEVLIRGSCDIPVWHRLGRATTACL